MILVTRCRSRRSRACRTMDGYRMCRVVRRGREEGGREKTGVLRVVDGCGAGGGGGTDGWGRELKREVRSCRGVGREEDINF